MSETPKQPFDDIDLMLFADGESGEDLGGQSVGRAGGSSADQADAGGDSTRRQVGSASHSATEIEPVEIDALAQSKIDGLAELGDAVRTYLELAADDVQPRLDAMWSAIEVSIDADSVKESSSLGQAHGASAQMAARAQGAAGPADAGARPDLNRADAHPGLWQTLKSWFAEHRGHFVSGGLAAAAAAALVLVLQAPPPPTQVVVSNATGTGTATSPPVVVTVSTPPEVEALEVSGGAASIFTLPSDGEDDVATGVIWLDLDPDEQEGPI